MTAAVATAPAAPARPAARRPALPAWALLPLAAAVWWVGGYLWWLLGGAAPGVSPGRGTSLPLDTSLLSGLVLGAAVGGIAAGLLGRLAARRGPALAATAGGVALAVVVTLAQSSSAVRTGAPGSFASDSVVLTWLAAAVVGTAAAGWLLGSLSVLGRPSAGPALGVLAGLAPSWVSSVLVRVVGAEAYASLDRVATWAGAVVLVLALVAVGLRPAVRLLGWPVVLLLAWYTGPALTALVYLEPLLRSGAGLPDTLVDSLSAAWQVFGEASSPEHRAMTPWVVAVVGAVVGAFAVAGVLATREHTRAPAESPGTPAVSPSA